jgi:hypothetical protein
MVTLWPTSMIMLETPWALQGSLLLHCSQRLIVYGVYANKLFVKLSGFATSAVLHGWPECCPCRPPL